MQVTPDLTSFFWATPADALCACSLPSYTNRVWGGFEPGIFLRVCCVTPKQVPMALWALGILFCPAFCLETIFAVPSKHFCFFHIQHLVPTGFISSFPPLRAQMNSVAVPNREGRVAGEWPGTAAQAEGEHSGMAGVKMQRTGPEQGEAEDSGLIGTEVIKSTR